MGVREEQLRQAHTDFAARQAEEQRRREAGLCDSCGKRPGSIKWGDMLALTHGGGELRCGVCVYGPQLLHALGRVVAIPRLLVLWVVAVVRGR